MTGEKIKRNMVLMTFPKKVNYKGLARKKNK